MIEQSEAGGDAREDPLPRLSGVFDIVSAPLNPVAHMAAAVPNARALERWPDFPRAALPASGRVGAGCAAEADAARRRALGEAVELASCCHWGDEAMILASPEELGDRALSPEALNGFSADQLRDREAWNARHARFDWRPKPLDPRRPIAWLESREALSGAPMLVPAEIALIGLSEPGDETAAAVADSNGCACGATPEAAQLAAILELIERDATGRWWHRRRSRATIAPESLEDAPELVRFLADRPRITRLQDITSDLGVPVVAAASAARDGRAVALGFAAGPTLRSAARAAVMEMMGIETRLEAPRGPGEDPELDAWLARVRLSAPPLRGGAPVSARGGPTRAKASEALSACLEALSRQACRAFLLDMTRPAFRTPVWRALSPELCHCKPRFARPRLMAGPAAARPDPDPFPLVL